VPCRLGDLELATDLCDVIALVEQLLALSEFSDHLFGSVVPLFHAVLLLHFGVVGLALLVAQLSGVLPLPPEVIDVD